MARIEIYCGPVDTDYDGMPDAWELTNKLNPNNPDDRNTVGPLGYTQLEIYLNSFSATR